MALFWQHQEPGWRWGVWKMEETYEELCALLPHAVVMQAEQSFSSLHRRQEWLSVRALLAQCAGSGVQIDQYFTYTRVCCCHAGGEAAGY